MRRNNWHAPLPPVDLAALQADLQAGFDRMEAQRRELLALTGSPRQWRRTCRAVFRKMARQARKERRAERQAGDMYPRTRLSVYAPSSMDLQVCRYNARLLEASWEALREVADLRAHPVYREAVRDEHRRRASFWRGLPAARLPA